LAGTKLSPAYYQEKKTSTRVRYQKAELKLDNPPAVARVRASTTRRGPVAHLECAAACSSCRGAPGWPENDPGKGDGKRTKRPAVKRRPADQFIQVSDSSHLAA